jgi:hypothetical protein
MLNTPFFIPTNPQVVGKATIGAASVEIVLPTPMQAPMGAVQLLCMGTVECYVRWGTGAQVALTTDVVILPGNNLIIPCFSGGDNLPLHVAVIGTSGTLYAQLGTLN